MWQINDASYDCWSVAFSLQVRKVPKKEIDQRVHEVAKILEIEYLLDRKASDLSGGQKQPERKGNSENLTLVEVVVEAKELLGADLVQVYDIGTRFMIDSDWIVPMQSFMDQDTCEINLEPNIASYYTVEDTLYSMPFNSSTPILYYNKDMFQAAGIEKAPATFQEITQIADVLTSKGGASEVLSMSIYGWFFEQFLCK